MVGIIFSLIGIIITPFFGAIWGSVIAIIGIVKSRKALKKGDLRGVIGIILGSLPVLYLLFNLIVIVYLFTSK